MFLAVTKRTCTFNRRHAHSQVIASLGGLHRIHDGNNLDRALQAVERLDLEGEPIPKDLAYCILQGCTKRKDLAAARQLRAIMVRQEMVRISLFADYLIRLFGLCGCLSEAEEIFSMVRQPTIYTWNAIISAHANLKSSKQALVHYYSMWRTSVKPSKVTFLLVLKACTGLAKDGLAQGRMIHDHTKRCGFLCDEMIGNALVDMYAKCGSIELAQDLFEGLAHRSVVSYGALIDGCVQNGLNHIAFKYFESMLREGIKPNRVIFLCLLRACSKMGALEQVVQIHDHIINNGLLSDVVVGTALVDTYAKCEDIERACLVFDRLPTKNVVSWGAIIGGLAQHGDGRSALWWFGRMQHDRLKPDRAIYLAVLKACASNGSSIQGRMIHHQIVKNNLENDISIGNSLVDMYAKCCTFEESHDVFDKLQVRDIVSWGALITGYALNGYFKEAWNCVMEMDQAGISPSEIIFTSILAGCSNSGLVKEGYEFFNAMIVGYGATPTVAHYNCMVDLLGRIGCLEEAWRVLQNMPGESSIVAYRSLLAGCKTYGNRNLGKLCFEEVARLDPRSASSFAMLLKTYGDADMWEDIVDLQKLKRSRGVWKKPGRAYIEIATSVHEFTVGERSLEQGEPIDENIKRLAHRILKVGYIPALSFMEQCI
ncbi:hypothetical protein KP509_04G040300 [Ceratopteris richardii]|uniref:Pentatricopeptide repeat-containing protein n=1 Tax=Ceratopteris richardii TaxID=49495 RepID=A0A8T2UW84_CERRI|nr:hypothetical protein KP509_04G040300 [Ceratopteris richardii]